MSPGFAPAFDALRHLGRIAAAALVAILPAPRAAADPVTVRIGVQKFGTLTVARDRSALEQKFAGTDIRIQWSDYVAGPQMLAVLGRDGLDLACVGEAPPIFSQATDMPVVYVGYAPAAPAGEAILVARDSPIRTLADLKGRRVAVSRGSNGHFLLLQALAKGGLGPDDVTPVFLAPQDGWIAFERGSVDAWAIWDPFLSVAQSATQARALVDGRGLAGNRYFYISTRKFAADHADLLRTVLGIINDSDLWSKAHPDETIALLARRTGVTRGGLKAAVERMGYGVTALDPATVADQQLVADAFARLNLLPGPLSIADAVWHGPN